MKEFIKNNWKLLLVIFLSLLIFSPALNTFFFGDDWFHLYVIQIDSIKEFFNFFDPRTNPQSISFYRPLPTQVFFYIFYSIFRLQALFYHLFWFVIFGLILFYVYKLGLKVGFSKNMSALLVLFFGFSHTNFSKLYFLSAGQELLMFLFLLLGLNFNFSGLKVEKKNLVVSLLYVLALLSKESAIIFPIVLFLFDIFISKQFSIRKYVILGFISLIYLYIRFVIFGFEATIASTDTYTLNFSPRLLINTTYMYIIWAFGGAELLQDYMRSPIQLIERYYTDFKLIGKVMIVLLSTAIATVVFYSLKVIKKVDKQMFLGVFVFVIGLLPFIFFPSHKFTIQMSVSMFGFSIFLVALLRKLKTVSIVIISILFIALNLVSLEMTYNTHYSIQRSKISKNVYEYMQTNHSDLSMYDTVVFLNAQTRGSEIKTWGSSKQISHALMGENFFKVLYPETTLQIVYEDLTDEFRFEEERTLYLSSDIFIE